MTDSIEPYRPPEAPVPLDDPKILDWLRGLVGQQVSLRSWRTDVKPNAGWRETGVVNRIVTEQSGRLGLMVANATISICGERPLEQGTNTWWLPFQPAAEGDFVHFDPDMELYWGNNDKDTSTGHGHTLTIES